MPIHLVSSVNGTEVHGTDNEKKTGCGIRYRTAENMQRFNYGPELKDANDLKQITCDRCKEVLARRAIKESNKEEARMLREEKKRGAPQAPPPPRKQPTSAPRPVRAGMDDVSPYVPRRSNNENATEYIPHSLRKFGGYETPAETQAEPAKEEAAPVVSALPPASAPVTPPPPADDFSKYILPSSPTAPISGFDASEQPKKKAPFAMPDIPGITIVQPGMTPTQQIQSEPPVQTKAPFAIPNIPGIDIVQPGITPAQQAQPQPAVQTKAPFVMPDIPGIDIVQPGITPAQQIQSEPAVQTKAPFVMPDIPGIDIVQPGITPAQQAQPQPAVQTKAPFAMPDIPGIDIVQPGAVPAQSVPVEIPEPLMREETIIPRAEVIPTPAPKMTAEQIIDDIDTSRPAIGLNSDATSVRPIAPQPIHAQKNNFDLDSIIMGIKAEAPKPTPSAALDDLDSLFINPAEKKSRKKPVKHAEDELLGAIEAYEHTSPKQPVADAQTPVIPPVAVQPAVIKPANIQPPTTEAPYSIPPVTPVRSTPLQAHKQSSYSIPDLKIPEGMTNDIPIQKPIPPTFSIPELKPLPVGVGTASMHATPAAKSFPSMLEIKMPNDTTAKSAASRPAFTPMSDIASIPASQQMQSLPPVNRQPAPYNQQMQPLPPMSQQPTPYNQQVQPLPPMSQQPTPYNQQVQPLPPVSQQPAVPAAMSPTEALSKLTSPPQHSSQPVQIPAQPQNGKLITSLEEIEKEFKRLSGEEFVDQNDELSRLNSKKEEIVPDFIEYKPPSKTKEKPAPAPQPVAAPPAQDAVSSSFAQLSRAEQRRLEKEAKKKAKIDAEFKKNLEQKGFDVNDSQPRGRKR